MYVCEQVKLVSKTSRKAGRTTRWMEKVFQGMLQDILQKIVANNVAKNVAKMLRKVPEILAHVKPRETE